MEIVAPSSRRIGLVRCYGCNWRSDPSSRRQLPYKGSPHCFCNGNNSAGTFLDAGACVQARRFSVVSFIRLYSRIMSYIRTHTTLFLKLKTLYINM